MAKLLMPLVQFLGLRSDTVGFLINTRRIEEIESTTQRISLNYFGIFIVREEIDRINFYLLLKNRHIYLL